MKLSIKKLGNRYAMEVIKDGQVVESWASNSWNLSTAKKVEVYGSIAEVPNLDAIPLEIEIIEPEIPTGHVIEVTKRKKYEFIEYKNGRIHDKWTASSLSTSHLREGMPDDAMSTLFAMHYNQTLRFDLSRIDASIMLRYYSTSIRDYAGETEYAAASDLLDAFYTSSELPPDVICRWDSIQDLASVDIDYHNIPLAERPTEEWFRYVIDRLELNPPLWFRSHGSGCKLFYVRTEECLADDIAAFAGFLWATYDPRASIEIKADCRHPKSRRTSDSGIAGRVHKGSTETRIKNPVTGVDIQDVDTETRDQYLADTYNAAVGDRLNHQHCPIAPSHGSDAVYVGESGLFCHRCHAVLGQGFRSYAQLIRGSSLPSTITTMIKWCTHWHHAKRVFQHIMPNISEYTIKKCYRAALLSQHPQQKVDAVFSLQSDFVRGAGVWVLAHDGVILPQKAESLIAKLPATWVGAKPDKELVTLFQTTTDLTQFGYPPLKTIRGARIYSQHLPFADDTIPLLLQNSLYRKSHAKSAARYVTKDDRMDAQQYKEVYEQSFPDINWAYLELLIVAAGIAEGEPRQNKAILVDGPSGSGKSGTVEVAAMTIGSKHAEVTYCEEERFRQQIIAASLGGAAFVRGDEIFKTAERKKTTPRQALDPLLQLTPESTSHVMYIGPVPLGDLPVVVFTDVYIPESIKHDLQLARRVIYVHLDKRQAHWPDAINQTIKEIGKFRITSDTHAHAANSFMSDIIDKWFVSSCPTLQEVSEALGFTLLENAQDFRDSSHALCRLYECVSSSTTDESGWVCIRRTDSSSLANAWREVADSTWHGSRRCKEQDWSMILGVDDAVSFDCVSSSDDVMLRFRVGSWASPDKVNGAITNEPSTACDTNSSWGVG